MSSPAFSEALRIAGVRCVLTHEDVPGRKTYGLEVADQPVLAIDEVRYQGEMAAVIESRRSADARQHRVGGEFGAEQLTLSSVRLIHHRWNPIGWGPASQKQVGLQLCVGCALLGDARMRTPRLMNSIPAASRVVTIASMVRL